MGLATGSLLLLITVQCFTSSNALPCVQREYGQHKIVCVCNETYCDTLEKLKSPLVSGAVYVATSTKSGERFKTSFLTFEVNKQETNTIEEETVFVEVDASEEFQEIIGFGGAFTDAAGINFLSLPESMKFDIVNAYYSEKGSEYNMGRVPMASCDFSTHPYSYDDHEGDLELQHFQLVSEDYEFKIPFIKRAESIATEPLLLFGSPWAPPAWMKSNNKMENAGTLKGPVGGEYFQVWANYFVKFLQAYEENDIHFWGMTVENEPSMGFITKHPWQCLGLTAETELVFVAEHLGPALAEAGYGVEKIKLMILDDQRLFLPEWAEKVFANETAKNYVSGIGFHWYMNFFAPPRLLDKTYDAFPDKFLLATEACEGYLPWQEKVILGDWGRAETYAHDIVQDLQHWTTGWIDWNLALDLEGGPNWVQNFVDSPIIVNATAAEFYKQPMYYALAHFSKFLKRGSKRITTDMDKDDKNFEVVGFKRPEGEIVLVALNRNSYQVAMDIKEKNSNSSIHNILEGNSIQTFVWKTQNAKDEL